VETYLALARTSFQRQLAYRAANLAGIATNVFFGAVTVLVYLALFRERSVVAGYDVRDAVTYAVVVQAMLMAVSSLGSRDIEKSIRNGEVAVDLSRPFDYYWHWAAREMGRLVYFAIFRGLPTFGVGWLLFGARLPATLEALVGFLVSLALAMALSFAIQFLINASAFWTLDATGIIGLSNTVMWLFSGILVPVSFFPPWLQAIAGWLPFQGQIFLPISIYLGKATGASILRVWAVQATWILILVLLGRLVLRLALRKVVVQGG